MGKEPLIVRVCLVLLKLLFVLNLFYLVCWLWQYVYFNNFGAWRWSYLNIIGISCSVLTAIITSLSILRYEELEGLNDIE